MAFLVCLLCGALEAGAVRLTSEQYSEPAARMLVPVGHTAGVKLFAKGVVVVKLNDGGTPAKECGLQTGDVILQCAGSTVTSTEQFQSLLQKCGGNSTNLQIQRNGDAMTLSVEPTQNDKGVYCIGAWIRDSMAGIGTITYVDPKTGEFGALGHGITDVDTAQLMPFADGALLPSKVKAVKKGAAGAAGELRGDFDLTTEMGELTANTGSGVFGVLDEDVYAPIADQALPVGTPAVGKAIVRTNVRGDAVEEYEIEVLKVIPDAVDGRNMVLSITDSQLIDITGGIVQGMSGSPIIQDGKLVGAVTHVLLKEPTKGYGISIETMLSAAA